jgi:hypothetical protein
LAQQPAWLMFPAFKTSLRMVINAFSRNTHRGDLPRRNRPRAVETHHVYMLGKMTRFRVSAMTIVQ